jgi:hypothetical protein
MASELKIVMGQIVTQIKNANGSGVYVHDLSATGTVVRGAVLESPQSSVAVGVYLQHLNTEPGARLGYWERTALVGIHGWVAHDGTEGDAEDVAADLLNDITRALEADRTLGGNVRDINASGTAFAGNTYGIGGWAIAAIDLRVNWSQRTGV